MVEVAGVLPSGAFSLLPQTSPVQVDFRSPKQVQGLLHLFNAPDGLVQPTLFQQVMSVS
jgi:hypothetical protein